MERPPITQHIEESTGAISRPWVNWFNKLWIVTGRSDISGTTANRPTSDLYVGLYYYDTTLSKPIWLKSVRPTVWILADGTTA
jgi:hypothetical protein